MLCIPQLKIFQSQISEGSAQIKALCFFPSFIGIFCWFLQLDWLANAHLAKYTLLEIAFITDLYVFPFYILLIITHLLCLWTSLQRPMKTKGWTTLFLTPQNPKQATTTKKKKKKITHPNKLESCITWMASGTCWNLQNCFEMLRCTCPFLKLICGKKL